jgi:hypothetical protein
MKKEVGSMAVGRLGRVLDRRTAGFDVLFTGVVQKVNRHAGSTFGLSEFPVELRLYKRGSSMEWHRDDVLYAPEPQCEVVLTLENSSDAVTEWADAEGELHSHWTPPNSALLVRAGESGARHRVSELKRGERLILKMVFAPSGSERAAGFLEATAKLHGVSPKSARALAGGSASKRGRREDSKYLTPAALTRRRLGDSGGRSRLGDRAARVSLTMSQRSDNDSVSEITTRLARDAEIEPRGVGSTRNV